MQKIQTARIYLRVSTDSQDLERQRAIIDDAKARGFYIGGIYEDIGTGTTIDRPELQRLLKDLQPGDTVIAERLDRLTRLPFTQAVELCNIIRQKGAHLCIPGIVDLSALAGAEVDRMARVVLDACTDMLLKIALQVSREDFELRRERQRQGIELAKERGKYTGRKPDLDLHRRILELLDAGFSVRKVAATLQISPGTVMRAKKSAYATQTPDF